MNVSTNVTLNKLVIWLGKISGGRIEKVLIHILYLYRRISPPSYVKTSRMYYEAHLKDIQKVYDLLEDESSKNVYLKMIEFRSTYDMRKHPEYSLDDVYFIDGIIKCGQNEIFVDCGAFCGDSIEKFLTNTNGKYNSIVAFEPDNENFCNLSNNVNKNNVYLYKAGVYSENKTMYFEASGNEGSKIVENISDKATSIKVVALDGIKECQEATYIKMDIEGSEYYALQGAANIIKRNRPKLAVSIYHKDEDMVKIPLYIHSLVPEYKMYVRQHSHSFFDTVLYCVLESKG